MMYLHYKKECILDFETIDTVFSRTVEVEKLSNEIQCKLREVTSMPMITVFEGVTFDGIHYRVGNAVVPGFDNIYMRFARVELMFMYQKNLYLVFVTLDTEFDPHYNAYEVIRTLDHGIISSSSLADPFPLGVYEIGAGNYITLRHQFESSENLGSEIWLLGVKKKLDNLQLTNLFQPDT